MSELEKLRAPIECLIAYHEKEARDHVSSQWIYGEHMFAVRAYKKVLTMIDQIVDGQPMSNSRGGGSRG